MRSPERAVPGPTGEIVVHRAPGWQVLGRGAPPAARRQDVEDPVQHRAHGDGAPPATALGRRDEGCNQHPLRIGQIARIAQARALMRLSLLGCPHRASPPCPTSTDNPLPRFGILPDGLSARLCRSGYGDRLLLSQDVGHKHYLREFGGWGYGHVLDAFRHHMEEAGIDAPEIDRFLNENPARVLSLPN